MLLEDGHTLADCCVTKDDSMLQLVIISEWTPEGKFKIIVNENETKESLIECANDKIAAIRSLKLMQSKIPGSARLGRMTINRRK